MNKLDSQTTMAKVWHEWKLYKDRKFEEKNSPVRIFVQNSDDYKAGVRPVPCME